MTKTSLYKIEGSPAAHYLIGLRECEVTPTAGEPAQMQMVADVQMIGAVLPYSVPAANLSEYTNTTPPQCGDTIATLAQEAAVIYKLDPKRVQKAAEIARNKYSVQPAKRDEYGNEIKPSYSVLCVKGSSGWYVVKKNFCTCEDHKRGHVCKHRIAAWMTKEMIARPQAAAARITTAEYISNYME